MGKKSKKKDRGHKADFKKKCCEKPLQKMCKRCPRRCAVVAA